MWAEDGAVFLSDAMHRPFLETVFEPYRGYGHPVPRTMAWVASVLPLEWAALVLSGGAALVLALLAAFVYRANEGIRSVSIRVAISVAVIVLPVSGIEVLNNAANLHWFFIFASFWALVWFPSSGWLRLVSAMIVGLASLSNPLTVCLTPAVLLRLALSRGWRDHAVTVAWAGGLAIQAATVWSAPSHPFAGAALGDLAAGYGALVSMVGILGVRVAGGVWPATWFILPWLGLVIAAAVVVYSSLGIRLPMMRIAVVAVACSLLLFAASQSIRGVEYILDRETMGLSGARYLVVPTLLLLSAVAIAIDNARPPRAVLLILRAWFVAVAIMNFSMSNARDAGPSWEATLGAARISCTDRAAVAHIEIAPADWLMHIDCSRIGP